MTAVIEPEGSRRALSGSLSSAWADVAQPITVEELDAPPVRYRTDDGTRPRPLDLGGHEDPPGAGHGHVVLHPVTSGARAARIRAQLPHEVPPRSTLPARHDASG